MGGRGEGGGCPPHPRAGAVHSEAERRRLAQPSPSNNPDCPPGLGERRVSSGPTTPLAPRGLGCALQGLGRGRGLSRAPTGTGRGRAGARRFPSRVHLPQALRVPRPASPASPVPAASDATGPRAPLLPWDPLRKAKRL